jgi:molecular chaperone DnaK
VGLIVGIDLGTTFSAVARLDETGRPLIVHSTQGENITASVIAFESEQQTTIGTRARRMIDAPNVASRFKREMGTDKVYDTSWGAYTPTQLSAILLRKLKSETEKATRSTIDAAVVTIPANFSNEAREATLAAATAAGLPIQHMINEPTAAALYYAFSAGTDLAGVYAVFDLGGGTFDVTIIRVDGKNIEVLASEGVNRLGGDDFDVKLIELVRRKYSDATGGELDKEEFGRPQAEDLKKELSLKQSDNARARGTAGRKDIQVTRTEFEEAISTQLAQIELLCETAIEEADVAASDIREIILAGGSTRMPAVHQIVKRVFGREPITFGNPDEVVALGAAIYAAYRADTTKLNPVQRAAIANVKVAEITNKYFGTIVITHNQAKQSEELSNAVLIRKGAKLPASITETFFTTHEGQTAVNCTVTEASLPESDPRFARIIWKGELGGLPPGRPANQPIEITFSYDLNQIMTCSFKDAGTGRLTNVELSMLKASGEDGFDIERFTVE